jgi:hypothetical protein
VRVWRYRRVIDVKTDTYYCSLGLGICCQPSIWVGSRFVGSRLYSQLKLSWE